MLIIMGSHDIQKWLKYIIFKLVSQSHTHIYIAPQLNKNNVGMSIYISYGTLTTKKIGKNRHLTFAMFVRPFICVHITTQELLNRFSWNFILWNFTNFTDIFKFWLKSGNNNGHSTWRSACISVCVLCLLCLCNSLNVCQKENCFKQKF